jgi:hypothetical protein
MRVVIGIAGVLAFALGLLWLLQGLDAVHVRPIPCVADRAEIQERSATWAIVGAAVMAAGGFGLFRAFKR